MQDHRDPRDKNKKEEEATVNIRRHGGIGPPEVADRFLPTITKCTTIRTLSVWCT